MADSSNSTAGSQSTGSQTSTASTGSTTSGNGVTTSNSTGNFSGRLPGLGGGSWSSPSSETQAARASGVQGPGLANGNFGSSWSGNGNSGSGSDDYTYNNTSYSNNKSEPVMTVDEVYGKTETGVLGNQSIVESQGDYAASSNEKSSVETPTFGKQDNITVTPESVTENKGLVDNPATDSIEGLNFQQKDKESQDVMEAKKNRDDAEAEDKANRMRESLKAKIDPTAEEDAISKFQIGNNAQAQKDVKDAVNRIKESYKKGEMSASEAGTRLRNMTLMADYSPLGLKTADMVYLADGPAANPSALQGRYVGAEEAPAVTPESKAITAENAASETKQTFDNAIQNAVEEEAAAKTKAEEAVTTEAPSYETRIEAAKNEINNSKDLSDEQKAEANTVLDNVKSSADAMNEAANALAANPNDIAVAQKYIEVTAEYNKALKKAKGNKTLENTNYNKTFTEAVAAANDFKVTKEDGTQQNYDEFAAETVVRSPEIAKGLYELKAQKYEADNHPVLAKIERVKSKMVMTWLGSKFTFADNQVRNQFNQMAKTDMSATYAAYDNVLNDPNESPERKAEASAAINQANSLMTASTALQASTGFLSGIGDGTSDGVYGVTDPKSLNAYQKTLNTIDNYAKIILGLGVTPGANKAYQNMYYMAGAKVNESGLYSRDFDGDGFALCQEYGNNAAASMIAGAGELATGIALMFNPAMSKMGINLAIDSVQTFTNGLYGVQKDVRKSEKYTQEVLSYFKEAESIVAETGNKEVLDVISSGITQIENFELKSDEVGNLDNWLEGSGSNTATNEKFNQSLTYDEWLKLIEADPTMQEYAKKLIAEKKEK